MTKPSFEHRHFKVIADIIAKHDGDRRSGESVADFFARHLAYTNPRFSRERFLAAANGEPCNGRDKVRS